MTRLNKDSLKGIYTALATPFLEDGSVVDYRSLERLLEYQITSGVNGFVICGSTGEAATLSEEEFKEIVKFVTAVNSSNLPCIVGIGSNDTRRACQLAEYLAEQSKVDGLLVVTPPYVKPTQEGIVEHFRRIKKSAKDLALIAYNIPGRAVANILPQTVARLVDENIIIGIKDSTCSIDQALDTELLIQGRISVIAGDDSLILPLMACGGKGAISGPANAIPEILISIYNNFSKGEIENARRSQLEALPLIRALFMETNPIPVKAALKLKGIFSSSTVRLPLTNAQPSTVDYLQRLFKI